MSRVVNKNATKTNSKVSTKGSKKMSVKMKAIISSAVAVVCVAALALGLIFGLKKPDGKPTYKFSASQQILANEINSNVKYDVFDIVDSVPYSKYTTIENLTRYGDSYFAYTDSYGNEQFYVYWKDAQGVTQTRCLTDQQGFIDTSALSWSVEKMHGDYLVIANFYDTNKYSTVSAVNIRFDLVSIKDPSNPKVIFKFDTRGMDCFVNNTDIVLKDNYFAITYLDNIDMTVPSATYNSYFYAYSDEFIAHSPTHENNFISGLPLSQTHYTTFDYKNSGFLVTSGTKQTYYYLAGSEFKSIEKDIVIGNNSQVETEWKFIELSNDKLLLEKTNYLPDDSNISTTTIKQQSSDQLGVYLFLDKSYELYNLESGLAENMNFSFKSGFASANKLSLDEVYTSSSFAIAYQKVDSENKLIDDYLVVYYDANGNEIVNYATNDGSEQIVYASSNTFVTTKNILQPQNNINTVKLFDFSDKEYCIDTELGVNSDYIVLNSDEDTKAGVIDVWGNMILDPETCGYTRILDLVDGKCVAYDNSQENGFIVNLKTGIATELDNYEKNPLITGSGTGLNISKDASAQISTIKNIYGTTVAENVTELKVPSAINGFEVIEIWTSADKAKATSYVVFNKVGEDETVSHTSYTGGESSSIEQVSNHSSTYSSYGFTYGTLTLDDWAANPNATLTLSAGRRVSSGKFVCNLGTKTFSLTSFTTNAGPSYQTKRSDTIKITYSNPDGASFVKAPAASFSGWTMTCTWQYSYLGMVIIVLPASIVTDQCSLSTSILYHYTYWQGSGNDYYDIEFDSSLHNRANTMDWSRDSNSTALTSATSENGTSPSDDFVYYGHLTHYRYSRDSAGNFAGAWYGPSSYNNSNVANSSYSLSGVWELNTGYTLTFGEYYKHYFYAYFVQNTYDLYVDGSLFDNDRGVNKWSSKIYYPTKTGYTFTGWSYSGFENYSATVRYYKSDGTYYDQTLSGYSGTISAITNGTYIHLIYTGGVLDYGYTAYLTANWTANIYTIDLVLDATRTIVNNGTTKVYYKYDDGMYLDAACTTYRMTQSQNPITQPIAVGYKAESEYTFTRPGYTGTYGPIRSTGYAWFNDDPDTYALNIYYYNIYIAVDGVRAFYSKWTPIKYTISYPSGCTTDGSNTQRTTTVTYDSVVTIPKPTGLYYDFNGFSISGASTDCTHYYGSTTSANSGSFTGATKSLSGSPSYVYFKNLWGTVDASKAASSSHGTVTLSANWLGKQYKVAFTMNGGGSISTKTFRYGTAGTISDTVSRAGYNFAGWDVSGMDSVTHSFTPSGSSTATTCTTTTKSLDATFKSLTVLNLRGTYNSSGAVQTVTFSAKWSPITYNITYSLTNGSNEAGKWVSTESHPATAVYEQAFAVDPPAASGWPKGYDFTGWTLTQLGKNSVYSTSQNGTYTSIASTSSTTKTINTTGRLYFKNLAVSEGDTVKFQALWNAHEYNIAYVENGDRVTLNSSSATKAAFNANATIYAPTRPGYTFAGWSFTNLSDEITHSYTISSATSFTSTNGKYVNASNPNELMKIGGGQSSIKVKNLHYVTGATVTLTANWTPNSYTVTYHYTIDSDYTSYPTTATLNTVSKQTHTKTQSVVFSQYFRTFTVGAVETSTTLIAPTGHKIKGWYIIVGGTLGSTINTATEGAKSANTKFVCNPDTDYLYNYTFYDNHKSASATTVTNMHAYAIYEQISFTLKYYTPANYSAANDLSTYSFHSQVTVTFGSSVTLKSLSGNGYNVTNWLVTPNLYSDGGVNYSYRTISYNGTTKYTYAGIALNWGLSNVKAHDPENPVFYLYGEVNQDYDARSLSKLTFSKITNATYGDFWSVSAKSVSITGDIYIPNRYHDGTNDLPVKTVNMEGFYDCTSISNLYIPKNIETIGSEAFAYCEDLVSVTFEADSKLKSINSYAFSYCYELTSFTMPNSVTEIGSDCFKYCSKLATLTLSTSLKSLPSNFIYGNSLLTELQIPNSVVTIADNAFATSYLTRIHIPAGVTSIGYQQVSTNAVERITVDTSNKYFDSRNDCNAIISKSTGILLVGCKNTVMPTEGITAIGASAFIGTSWMAGGTAVIPEGVTTIHNYAFSDCEFVKVTLPSTLIAIGLGAFQRSPLADVILPYSLETLGNYAFYQTALTQIVVPERTVSVAPYAFSDCDSLVHVYIKYGVNTIGDYAFSGCDNLLVAYIPSSITYSGTSAFGSCSNASLYVGEASSSISGSWANTWFGTASVMYDDSYYASQSVLYEMYPNWDFYDSSESYIMVIDYNGSDRNLTIPAVVDEVYLGYYELSPGMQNATSLFVGPNVKLFSFNSGVSVQLTSLTLSPGLQVIDSYAFAYLTNLTSIHIPYTVRTIRDGIFWNATSLTTVTVDEKNPYFDSRDNCNAIIDSETNTLIAGVGSSSIPASVTRVKPYAFYYVSASTFTIPANIKMLETYAFMFSSDVTLTLSEGIDTIQREAITFGGTQATISIPASVKQIHSKAITGNNLTTGVTVSVASGNTVYDSRDNCNAIIEKSTNKLIFGSKRTTSIPSTVTAIGDYAFVKTSFANTFTIPSTVTSIGKYAFYYSSFAGNVSFAGVSKLEESVFEYATFTGTVTLPETLVEIGNNAFKRAAFNGQTSIQIPASVRSIGSYAFAYNTKFTSVVFNDGLVSIGNNAFYDATKIGSITLPNSVQDIGSEAFASMDSLTSISFGNGIVKIPNSVCYGNTNLTTFTIPEGVTEIGSSAFYNVIYGPSLVLPDGLKTIGNSAFYMYGNYTSGVTITFGSELTTIGTNAFNLSKLTELVLGDKVTSIGDSAFSNSSNLKIARLGNGAHSIGANAFSSCTALVDVVFSDNLKSIGQSAFNGCSALKKVNLPMGTSYSVGAYAFMSTAITTLEIPSNAVSIGINAFKNCTSLKYVWIHNAVSTITASSYSNAPFYGCSALVGVYTNASSRPSNWGSYFYYKSSSAATINYSKTIANYYTASHTGFTFTGDIGSVELDSYTGTATTVYIPSFVKTIGSFAFEYNSTIQKVVVPDGVTLIDFGAFSDCSELTTVILPLSLRTIEKEAFKDSAKLSNLIIPNGVTTIGKRAFGGTAINTLYIPASVTTMGLGTSVGAEICSSSWSVAGGTTIQHVIVDPDNLVYDSRDNCDAIIETATNKLVQGLSNTVIPASVTTIGAYAFYGVIANSIVIPDSVTTIETHAFFDTNIQNVSMSKVQTIGEYAFGSGEFVSIDFGTALTSIGDHAFDYDDKLTSIDIPDSVTYLGKYAFASCSSLTSVKLSKGITTIGERAFQYCHALTEIHIPANVRTIDNYAFYTCRGLTTVNMENGVTTIGEYAFEDCEALVTMNMSMTVTSIGRRAFYDCSMMRNFAMPMTVTSIGINAFYNCDALTYVWIPSGASVAGAAMSEASFYGCSSTLQIYTNATSKRASWGTYYHYYGNNLTLTVNFGASYATYFQKLYTNVTVTTSGSTLTLSSYKGSESSVVIPHGITGISGSAFYYKTGVTSITLPSSLTGISNTAFNGMSGLQTLIIREGLTELYLNVFGSSMTALTNIYLPSTMSNIIVQDNVTYLSNKVNIHLDADHQYYEVDASGNFLIEKTTNKLIMLLARAATSVTIPTSVVEIGHHAFKGSQITSVTIPANITQIENNAFENCANLASITFASGSKLKMIGESAFWGVGFTGTITIPEGVEVLAKKSFGGNYSSDVLSISIPSTVKAIGEQFMEGTVGNITIADANVYFSDENSNIILDKESGLMLAGSSNITTLPTTVKSIAPYAMSYRFQYSSSDVTFTIPANVKSIGDYAFANNAKLKTLTFNNGLVAIESYAFYKATALTKVILPSTLEYIDSYAFRECSNLAEVHLGSKIKVIQGSGTTSSAFYLCKSTLVIYCAEPSKPSAWGTYWYYINSGSAATVVWGNPL